MMLPLAQLLKDPPPSYAFELSEAGIAFAKIGATPQINFQPFEPGVLSVSPVHDNIQKPELLAEQINALVPPDGTRKRRAALILPDYCSRLAVLDFDAFPSAHEEQRALVRFRMKKSVPFDVDTAMVSYYAQERAAADKKIEVVVAIMATEIVSRYEAPFRAAGFLPGYVTTSALATLNMLQPDGVTLVVKVSGRTLTALVVDGTVLKLVRCVEIESAEQDDVEGVIHPTLAFIEDELRSTAKRILLCGLGPAGEHMGQLWEREWGLKVETLRSRHGSPGPANAGLLGYLESLEA
jgi:type IV pilus assembly protein PilM